MKKFLSGLDTVINIVIVIQMIIVVATVLLQILFRSVIVKPLSWSEELSRYAFIWIVYLGGYLAVRHKSQLGITLLTDRLSGKSKKAVILTGKALMIVYMAIVTFYGTKLSLQVMGQPSAVMRMPMGVVYMAIPLGMFLMFIGTVAESVEIIRERDS
ncbi:TRAP transporter small permease [Breznakiella homolactica]|uniref:TRAP transporter small permease n=1 Tax=Breznakiella homolactica TaxID=2798577 RepID=A0A7T7XNK0_9SPIR|nr:TRAP transporter small permease [Breznakiella homolactica]QQO09644.1 TRAP transporter small permease [Breznakiella homolactica]